MSPLVTVLFIMLLTVVYNDSQYIAKYQDEYDKIIPKNMRPFELCDEGLKKCKTTNIWRELLKNTDELFVDVHGLSRDYNQDYVEEEETRKIGQKRDYHPFININRADRECKIDVLVSKKPRHYFNFTQNVTCNYKANEKLHLPPGYRCQPVEHKVQVLYRKPHVDVVKDISENMEVDCFFFRTLSKNDDTTLSRYTPYDDTNEIAESSEGCWIFKEISTHVGCSLRYMG